MEVVWRGLIIKPKVFGLRVSEWVVVNWKDELLSINWRWVSEGTNLLEIVSAKGVAPTTLGSSAKVSKSS